MMTQSLHSQLGANGFPKITGHHEDFLFELKQLKLAGKLPDILDIEGTVKLHGMHADIVYNLNDNMAPSRSYMFQSRNRIVDADTSQHGWPKDLAQFPDAMVYIKDRVLTTFAEKNPDTPLDRTYPLIIAGEWVGGKTQKGVGLAQLSPRFVILTIQINGIWQKDADYKDIQAERASVYNVHACGSNIVTFDTSDISETNPALLEMQKIADATEANCPFAAKFGVTKDNMGEGVVWKPGTPEGRANPKCWLKTKGPKTYAPNRIDSTTIAANKARNEDVGAACALWVSPRRIEQAFEYLLENNIDPDDKRSIKLFIDWLITDIMEEEKNAVEEMQRRHTNAEKYVKSRIGFLGREAFLTALEHSGVRLA